MDYEKIYGFSPDEVLHWTSLKSQERTILLGEIIKILFTNIGITVLLIYSVRNEDFIVFIFSILWILVITGQAIESSIRLRRSSTVYQSMLEKVEKTSVPINK